MSIDPGVWIVKGFMDFEAHTGGRWWDLTVCLNISNTGTFLDGNGYCCQSISGMDTMGNMKYPMNITTFLPTSNIVVMYMYARSLGSYSVSYTNKSNIRALRIS